MTNPTLTELMDELEARGKTVPDGPWKDVGDGLWAPRDITKPLSFYDNCRQLTEGTMLDEYLELCDPQSIARLTTALRKAIKALEDIAHNPIEGGFPEERAEAALKEIEG